MGRTVTFSLSAVEDIFELRVPRLKIVRRRGAEKNPTDSLNLPPIQDHSSSLPAAESDRKTLRYEIRKWWQGLSEHMDRLVSPVNWRLQ